MKHYRTISGAEKALSQMRRKDLKRECVVRGMDFREASESSDPTLQSFFIHNFDVRPNPELLTDYDKWLEKFLIEERGYDPKEENWAFHPHLKLGFLGEGESAYIDDNEEKIARPKKQGTYKKGDVKKPKREKDEKTGLIKGTKKSITFDGAKKGLSYEEVCKHVLASYPDANIKSVLIWYKKACKQYGTKPIVPVISRKKKNQEDDVIMVIFE